MSGVFCCKGKRLTNYLLERDCKLLRVDFDQKSDKFLVFIFEKNENFLRAMQTWKKDKYDY